MTHSKLLIPFISILFLCISATAFSQNQAFVYIFKHNFENDPVGEYSQSKWSEDWNYPGFTGDNGFGTIQAEDSKYLREKFKAGTFFFEGSGIQWQTMFEKGYDELYFSYRIRISDGFQNQDLHAKLPGLSGGKSNGGSDVPDGTDGWSGRYMLESGSVCVYLYYPELYLGVGDTYLVPNKTYYGELLCFNAPELKADTWYVVTQRIVMNTPGSHNGIVEGYLNGKLVYQRTNFRFRDIPDLKIDRLYFSNFLGASGIRPTKDEYLDFDDFCVFQYADNMDVPRGNTASSRDRELILPYQDYFDQNWITGLNVSSKSPTSISINWRPYMFEVPYYLERKSASEASFTRIATLSYSQTSYTDINLNPSTTYTYRVVANNVNSNEKSASTPPLNTPAAPTNLNTSAINKREIRLQWKDNSSNETGFELYRSTNNANNFSAIARLNANTSTYFDSNLNPATTYYYAVRAYNLDGYSSYSNQLNVSTLPLSLPSAPSGLVNSQLGYTSVKLLWKDNSSNETGFEIERSGPNVMTQKKMIAIGANFTEYLDNELIVNSKYQYRIRSKNDDGVSAWSAIIEVVTPFLRVPEAPTHLKSTEYTDKSISVVWDDNSNNEDAFIISRSLAADPTVMKEFRIKSNDTVFNDTSLVPQTTYQYIIKAYNAAGYSSSSNKNVATTLSKAELKRVKKGLIAYYNFGFNPDYIVYDQSGYENPLNLHVLNRSAVVWNTDNTLEILGNTALVSIEPALKITKAIRNTNEVTFECWIKPKEPSFSDSRIVSLSSNDNDIGFLVNQLYNDDTKGKSISYSIRMQTLSTTESGYPEYLPGCSQNYLNLQHLVYVRDSTGVESFYLNGEKSLESFRPSDLNSWDDKYYFRLGNETDMNHSWKGSFYSVALYNTALKPEQVRINYNAGPCDSLDYKDLSYTINTFPNPVNDILQLQLIPDNLPDYIDRTYFRIVDMLGNILYEENIFNPNLMYTKELDFSKYVSGIYFLQVISGSSQKSSRIIVQH